MFNKVHIEIKLPGGSFRSMPNPLSLLSSCAKWLSLLEKFPSASLSPDETKKNNLERENKKFYLFKSIGF